MISLTYHLGLALLLAALALDAAYLAIGEISHKARVRKAGGGAAALGAVMLLASLGFASIEAGFPAMAGSWGVACVFSSTLSAFCATSKLRGGREFYEPRSGLACQLLACAAAALGAFGVDGASIAPTRALRSLWLPFHVGITVAAEALFAAAAVCAIGALVARKDTLRATLATIERRAIKYAFPLYGIGALALGSFWAEQAWGSFWSWDPKECFAVATWLCYAAYIHLRFLPSAPKSLGRWLAIAGFVLALFGYFGVNYLLPGKHSYL
jgi:ABC-type transport system involved in cytochrome c biogenesis permease subunit